jgi:hypothetical protein
MAAAIPEIDPRAEIPGANYLSGIESQRPEILNRLKVVHAQNIANGLFAPLTTFDVDPDPVGIMQLRSSKARVVERSEQNDLFFVKKGPWFELIYQNSNIIVSSLELFMQREGAQTGGSSEPRKYAFFDTQGNFYNQARLTGLAVDIRSNGQRMTKHTAYFDIPRANGLIEQKEIPVDNIYCIGGTRHLTSNYETYG